VRYGPVTRNTPRSKTLLYFPDQDLNKFLAALPDKISLSRIPCC